MTTDWGCTNNDNMSHIDDVEAQQKIIAGEVISNAKIDNLIVRNNTIAKITLDNCEIGTLDLSGSTCLDTVIIQNSTIGKTALSLQDHKEVILQTRFKQHVRIQNCKFTDTFSCIQGQFEGEFSCTAHFADEFLLKYNHFYQDISLNGSEFENIFRIAACNFDGHAWFRKITVHKKISWSRVIFAKKMNLGNSVFHDTAHIGASTFGDRAGWNAVTAKEKVEFLKCTFEGEFSSQGSVYSHIFNMNKCNINGVVSLANTTFEKKFNLSKSSINNQINTKDTIFIGAVLLDHISCEGTLNFNETTFEQDVFCRNSYLGGEDQQLNFMQTVFKKAVNFENTQLKSALVNFSEASFHKTFFTNSTWGTQSSYIDFSKCSFNHTLKLDNSAFVGQVNFNGSTFHRRAAFDKTIFHQTAFFRFCKFINTCSFEGTQFLKQSYFVGCHFQEVNFMNSEFEGAVRFATETAMTNCPENQNATFFEDNADFSNARFNKKALFQQVKFAKKTNFNNVYFGEQISFRHAQFDEDLIFSGAFCSLELDLRKINVKEELILKGANINRRINLADASFRKISFYNMVTDVIAVTPQQIDGKLRGDEKADNTMDVERTAQEYLALKKSFSIQGMHDEEDWAYWRFRRTKRGQSSLKAKKDKNIFVLGKNFLEKIFIDYGSNYGTHPFRITFLAALMIAAFGAFYWMFPGQLILEGDEIMKGQSPTLSQCIYFSVMAFTTMGFGDIHPDFYGWLKTVVAFEALVGIITMTLFVGTYARKIVR
ncbi:pentapeptide repeat-containing protein [Candidatus Uabimicrobium sp. HlEnr_7]|uniref:pentapeptide repeat-containing protein n=1 Tax=Candidatus Uabimicrobium helgolandensis TaxID=3095367 RepID=UPI00355843F9